MTSISIGKPRAAKVKGPVLSGDPTVQLLPPAVRDRVKNAEFRRLMVLLVVLAVAAVAGGVAYGLYRSIQAQDALAAANAETARILAEQETYRADAAVADVVEATHQAQQMVTATEVDWQLLYGELEDRLGSRAEVNAFILDTAVPWSSARTSPGQLRAVPTVRAALVVWSPNVITVAELTDRFSTIPGFLEVYFNASMWEEEEGVFQTTVEVAFDASWYIGRYAPAEEAPTEETPGEGDETEEAQQ